MSQTVTPSNLSKSIKSDLVRELTLGEHVEFMGGIQPLTKLKRAMATCEITINLRRPAIGKTSGTMLRAHLQAECDVAQVARRYAAFLRSISRGSST